MLVKLLAVALWLCLAQVELMAGRVLFARLEPYETYHVKAAVSGQIVEVRKDLLGRLLEDDTPIVRIDDKLDRQILALNEQTRKSLLQRIEALQKNLAIQKQIATDIANLKTKSRIQKDTEQVNAINAEVALAQAYEQLYGLDAEIAQKKDSISKKSLSYKGLYLYKIHVTEGDFVSSGTPLVDIMDLMRAKITFFLTQEEIAKLKDGKVYVDGEVINQENIERIFQVADSENISEYRVEVTLKSSDFFSRLVKVEVKD